MHALLMGYYGARNLGDEMMLVCLRRWLEAQDVDVTVLSEGASDIRERYGLSAVENVPLMGQWAWRDVWLRGKALALLTALRRHDALIVGGGDLIRDDRGWRQFLFAMDKVLAALILGKPVYLVNIGIGEPCTKYGRRLLKWTLPRCARIIARDRRTFDLCRDLGAGAVTEYAPDIVMSLPRILDDGSAGSTAAAPPYALVCLRTQADVFGQYAWTDQRIQALASGLDYLVERHGLGIVFLPFQSMPGGQDDNQIHDRVAASMTHRDRVTVRPWSDDLAAVSRAVREARCVIAMRLHAAVLACAHKRCCIVMPYDYKVSEFGRQMSLPHEITAETLDTPDKLRGVLDGALADGEVRAGNDLPASWDTLTLEVPGSVAEPITCW
jgi:polysaccharide pyruvyl transferase CsaB